MREISQVYLHTFLWSIGGRIVGIFVPAYLLSLGFSLQEVLVFFAVWALFVGISAQAVPRIQLAIGIKKTIVLGTLLRTAFFGLLFTLPLMNWPIVLLGAFNGIDSGIYFPARYSLFTSLVKRGREGSSNSVLFSMTTFADLVAPAVLAVVIQYAGFGYAAAVGIAFLLVSLVPIFLTRDFSMPIRTTWGRLYSRPNRKYLLFHTLDGLLSFTYLYWPLYVYVASNSFLVVGGAAALIQVGVIIYSLAMGRFIDNHSATKVAAIGSIATGALFAALLVTPYKSEIILVISVLIGIVTRSWIIPAMAVATKQCHKQGEAMFQALRENGLMIGREMASVPAAITASILTGFGISAALCLIGGTLLLAKGRKWFGED